MRSAPASIRTATATLSAALLAGCSLFGIRSGYEQPRYEVVGSVGDDIEIRRYGPRLAAATTVDAVSAEAGQNAAFRILAAYIFGANRAKSEIAMTAPVAVEAEPETIAMTAPVETAAAGEGRYAMRFFLPARLTMATAPQPTDARVRLVEVPAETIAALRFTGTGGSEAVDARRAELLAALRDSAWRPLGPPAAYFYDPP
ncbi:MAG: heme-binding protein, partial [Candidatus Binatia bacterium]